LNLQRVDKLPQPVYGFNPDGWLLFFFSYGRRDARAGEYVAVRRDIGDVKFLGPLG
jgi:hypothetical protein